MKNSKTKKLKILYHMPSLETIYANRTIYHGFKNAFIDMGHEFRVLTSEDNLENILKEFQPDIFITCSHNYFLKFLDLNLINEYRKKGMVMLTKIDFWNSPLNKTRINEAKSLKNEKQKVEMIKSGLLGDVFFHVLMQDDERMKGFYEETKKEWVTIPLAFDKTLIFHDYDEKFKSDLAFVGTYLPQKKDFFKKNLFPLKKQYDLKIYGQDWTLKDRILGRIQKFGQYFNIKFLKKVQKPKLNLEDERKIYSSSIINLNIHEDYQRTYGGDCNERTFKILACNGFEITDNVKCIGKFFKNGKEIIIAENDQDWHDKINYFMNHPDERKKIAENGMKKTLKYHTYHNRVKKIINLYKTEIKRRNKNEI